MADESKSGALLERLLASEDLSTFLRENEELMQRQDFCGLLRECCRARGLSAARVIERSGIERTYGYQLFNGTRRPSRDKALQLAVALELNVEETQRLLAAAGKSPLYPGLKRDAVLLFCLHNALPIHAVQGTLSEHGLKILGGKSDEKD